MCNKVLHHQRGQSQTASWTSLCPSAAQTHPVMNVSHTFPPLCTSTAARVSSAEGSTDNIPENDGGVWPVKTQRIACVRSHQRVKLCRHSISKLIAGHTELCGS